MPGSAELRRRRAAAQGLAGGLSSPRALLAVQAQDPRAAWLALRARGLDTTTEPLVVGWLMRGTLHLVAVEDYWWLHGLTARGRMVGNARRLAQEGVGEYEAGRAAVLVERWLGEDGPLSRAQLAERLGAAGIRVAGQALPHLLMRAALLGVAVLEPRGARRFVLARDVVGERVAVPHDAAVEELARRYLVAHAPASAADLSRWAGFGVREADRALAAVAPEAAVRSATEPGPVPPRLLPAFDPYLLGWRDRTFAVPVEHLGHVQPGGGMLRAVAVEDGAVVGTWTQPDGRVVVEWFDGVARAGFDAELAAVEAFD